MATSIRGKEKAKKIQEKILGKPNSANKPSEEMQKLNKRLRSLYTRYQR